MNLSYIFYVNKLLWLLLVGSTVDTVVTYEVKFCFRILKVLFEREKEHLFMSRVYLLKLSTIHLIAISKFTAKFLKPESGGTMAQPLFQQLSREKNMVANERAEKIITTRR